MIKVKMSNEVVIREEINSVEELSTDTTKYYHYTVDMLVQRKHVYFRVDGNLDLPRTIYQSSYLKNLWKY